MKRLSYEATVRSCFVAYIVQAIIVNFAPLLFVTFQRDFGISLSEVTLLITFNFLIQILVDLASAYFVDRIGYRAAMITAHLLSAAGLFLLSELPFMISNAYIALLISVAIYAIGGGLLEVVVSPVVEACPTKNKEKEMSLLHSFYCWGSVAVIGLSTLFFSLRGTGDWRLMAYIWSALPLANAVFFLFVPVFDTVADGKPSKVRSLLGSMASTANFPPRSSTCSPKTSMEVLLPAPGTPLIPTRTEFPE